MRSDKYEKKDTNKNNVEDNKKESQSLQMTREKKNQKDSSKKETNKKFSTSKKVIVIIVLIFILLYLLAKFLFPNIITVKETKIESYLIPQEFNGFKIVQISDIHYGTNINKKALKKIVKQVNELKPDIIIFTGDLFDKDISYSEDNLKDIEEILTNLDARLYKYAISGNEDANNNDFFSIMDNADFILLDNKAKILFNDGITPIVLFGLSPSTETSPDYEILDDEEYKDYYKIVLMHEPDAIENISNANLIFAGHSLGGIINIGKPLINYEGAKKYNKFENHIDNTDMYISNGLGTNKLNIRFINNPHINLYRLYSKTED